jgi:16S rRNA (cytosine967-C5)-methyltransferase
MEKGTGKWWRIIGGVSMLLSMKHECLSFTPILLKHVHIQSTKKPFAITTQTFCNEPSSADAICMNPRKLAVEALGRYNNKGNMDIVSHLESSQVFLLASQRDKSFTRNLVSTTMRRLGQIDSILTICCSSYPPKGKYGRILKACLRVGVAQLLFIETPSFAAVKETIDVLKDKSVDAPKPIIQFANAVLRRVDREREELLNKTSIYDNMSIALRKELESSYGVETTQKILNQLLDDSAHQFVDLTIRKNEDVDKIISAFEADTGKRFHSVLPLPNGSLRVRKNPNAGSIANWPLYEEGIWWVQDVSSTLPAIALIKALEKECNVNKDAISEFHVVDCCAAPGGKTAQLLSAGLTVTAIEASPRRSRRLVENLSRLNFSQEKFKIAVCSGQEWFPGEQIDVNGVLVDVPCSATGTGSKRPDVLQKDCDLGNLLSTQKLLANHCADNILKPGGIMVYATCSLLREESEEQVLRLLERGNMKMIPFEKGEIPGFDDAIHENGWLRVLPGMLGDELKRCDGFFVARLKKL